MNDFISDEALLKVKNAQKVNLPAMPGFKAELYPYQQIGVAYMYVAKTCNLFDQCGLGKTVQALGLLELLKERGELTKALVCTPNTLSSKQWASETSAFTTLLPACALGDKTDRVGAYGGMYDVLYATYPIIQRDWHYLYEIGFNVIIFDEAGYFRNPGTKTSKIAGDLARMRSWRINMTATPVQNSYQDLHTMFSVIGLERVVGSKQWFWDRYIRSIMIEGTSHSTGRHVRYPKIIGYRNVPELISRINPYFLRRTIHDEKVNVYLPPLTCTTKHVNMSSELIKEYKAASGKILDDDASGEAPISRMSMHALQKIIDKAKYPALMDMLKEGGDLSKEKVIVFAWYLPTIADIDAMLTQAGIGHVCITGDGNSKEDKSLLKERFEKDADCRVLVGTTAIEQSLNLQIGSYIVALDQFYNPTRTEQLIGRIRRIGSQYNKVVFVQLLVAEETIESRIPVILEQKAALANYVFSETSEIFPPLSKEDLRRLIGG